MVNFMINKEEQKRLEDLFRQLDINGDGMLQYDELLIGLKQIYGDAVGLEECKRIFQAVDTDDSGEIGFQEFMQASTSKEKLLDEKQLKQSFAYFDKDNSGKITP